MSAATEFAPAVCIPVPAGYRPAYDPPDRSPARPAPGQSAATLRLASVTTLHAPRDAAAGVGALRLTRRGIAVAAVAVAVLAGALLWLAVRSAPATVATAPAPHAVTVQSGDTLWSIASRVAPQRDPRAEVAALQRVNRLSDVDLTPGQTLRVP